MDLIYDAKTWLRFSGNSLKNCAVLNNTVKAFLKRHNFRALNKLTNMSLDHKDSRFPNCVVSTEFRELKARL
jgi:hypothetical protein